MYKIHKNRQADVDVIVMPKYFDRIAELLSQKWLPVRNVLILDHTTANIKVKNLLV